MRTKRNTRNLSAARQLSLRGMGLLEQEKHEDAATLFSEALEHSSADERAHWGLAEVQWENGNREEALRHMAQAVELSGPDGQQDPDLMVRLGELYRDAGDMGSARVYADLALRIDRQHALAWSLKGAVLQAQNQALEAMDCFQRSLIHDPANSDARVAVAKLYRQLGQPQRALATIDFLSDGHTAEEVPAQAWMLKGLALADLGEESEAKICLRNASRCADVDDHPLLLELASEYHRFGDSAEARVLLGMVMQTDPQNRDALDLQTALSQAFSGERPRLNSFPAGSVSPVN
ncbi:MAG: tetratricopeptide repeat protein [Pirellulaceae bacterium]